MTAKQTTLRICAALTLCFWSDPGLSQSEREPTPTFIEAKELGLPATLPRWPDDHTLMGRADLDAVLAFQATRTAELESEATADSVRGPVEWAQSILGKSFTAERYPQVIALLNQVHDDMRLINRAANAVHGLRQRPALRDRAVRPSLANVSGPDNPSYPSARTAGSMIWAQTLSELFPEHRSALFDAAYRTAWLRLLGGAHYPSDLEGGRIVAEQAWEALSQDAEFRRRLAEAREEVASFRVGVNP